MAQRFGWKRLIVGNLLHYWRTNLAVVAGVGTAVAVLAGALLVGGSVRESLANLIVQRIGATGIVVSADRFFREKLAADLTAAAGPGAKWSGVALLRLPGVVVHEATRVRALNVNVYGVRDDFWAFHGIGGRKAPEDRMAYVGEPLARKLGARAGDTLLLQIGSQQGIPGESLFGRRDSTGKTLRLTCGDVLPAGQLGEFALQPDQHDVYSIFVPLDRLQKDLAQPERVNTVLLNFRNSGEGVDTTRRELKEKCTLDDLGVEVRALRGSGVVAIESSRVLLDEGVAAAAFAAAAGSGMKASGIFTYLANSIRAGGREIPYSVITAADIGQGAMTSVRYQDGPAPPSASAETNDSILLSDWARRDLGISMGDEVEVDYYFWQQEGRLVTRTARFRYAGGFDIEGDVDARLAPDFPGITEADNIRDWDPPFPLDLRRIRPRDEDYWNRYRTTPKAFITLARGQELWQTRFGRLTSIRIRPPENEDLAEAAAQLGANILRSLDPAQAGFQVSDVRELVRTASRGSTDFGEYFVYFSFFLIGSALLLAALFFRLGVEQRTQEIGVLQSMGFAPDLIRRIFLFEGLLLTLAGSILGVLGAIGYGRIMLFGLRTWWVDAVGTQRLFLHVTGSALATGVGAGILASMAAVVLTLRGLRRNSPRTLLSGVLESHSLRGQRVRRYRIASLAAALGALLMILGSLTGTVSPLEGFFGAGCLFLAALLGATASFLRRRNPATVAGHGGRALVRLAIRNAMHRPGRSLLCVALIASAVFLIVSVEAFRRDPGVISLARESGTGGFSMIAQSELPIVSDLNSSSGRESLGITELEIPAIQNVTFTSFRLRPGDDVSCLNLYAPREPRILGAPQSFLGSGRFSFQNSLAETEEQQRNPWMLLESDSKDGSIPAVGDANTIQYILHLAIGKELTVRGGNGAPVRLRLVAALRDSVFQGELLISEANFLKVFPDQEGFRLFLLDAPTAGAPAMIRALEGRLAGWGFSVETTRERLAAYHRVENTYLSTFQSLGALGLVLGTIGLATVLLRNVMERRGELALLGAVGFRKSTIAEIILIENALLLVWGVAAGSLCALLAVWPAMHARGVSLPYGLIGLTLGGVLGVGLSASGLAVLSALRSPLLDALRSD